MSEIDINKLAIKALKELPVHSIEERLESYGRNSHLGSASEKAWLEFLAWKKKFGLLLLSLEDAP